METFFDGRCWEAEASVHVERNRGRCCVTFLTLWPWQRSGSAGRQGGSCYRSVRPAAAPCSRRTRPLGVPTRPTETLFAEPEARLRAAGFGNAAVWMSSWRMGIFCFATGEPLHWKLSHRSYSVCHRDVPARLVGMLTDSFIIGLDSSCLTTFSNFTIYFENVTL